DEDVGDRAHDGDLDERFEQLEEALRREDALEALRRTDPVTLGLQRLEGEVPARLRHAQSGASGRQQQEEWCQDEEYLERQLREDGRDGRDGKLSRRGAEEDAGHQAL